MTSNEIISSFLTPGLQVTLVVAIAFVVNRFALILIKKIIGYLVKTHHRDNNIEAILDEKRIIQRVVLIV